MFVVTEVDKIEILARSRCFREINVKMDELKRENRGKTFHVSQRPDIIFTEDSETTKKRVDKMIDEL